MQRYPYAGWMIDRHDATEILAWLGTALLVLALVNALGQFVPVKKQAEPEYVMNIKRR